MTEKAKNLLIGFFVSSAMAVIVLLILFLKPSLGDGKKTLRVRFANISGVTVGTRVTFAGKPVGEVVRIQEVADARQHIESQSGAIYFYELLLQIDSSVELYTNDEITIRSAGLMGEKSVAIIPHLHQGAEPLTRQVLFASNHDPMEQTIQQMALTAKSVEKAFNRFDGWLKTNEHQLAKTIDQTQALFQEIQNTFALVNQEGLISSIKESTEQLNAIQRSIRSSLENDQLLYKVANLVESLDKTASLLHAQGVSVLSQVDQTLQQINSGSGAIGQILFKDDLYLQLNSLFSKADTMMNDINHYGLLFQYSKKWQRSRTKRANLLAALESPAEFRAYFTTEIDGISTAISRLYELLERSKSLPSQEPLSDNDAFKKEFANLLRNIEALRSTIKKYSEDLYTTPGT